MLSANFLLTHGLIVTQDAARTVIADGAIAIAGERIAAVGPTAELVGQFQAGEVVDLGGDAVFPGLIDVHTHLFQTASKGLGEAWPVHEWVGEVTAPIAAHIRPEETYLVCLTGCLEHIHSGVTSLIDMSYAATSYELHEANIQAMLDSGLRARYSSIIADYGEFNIPAILLKPIDRFLQEYRRLLAQFPPGDRMAVWPAIGAPWVATDEAMIRARAFSREVGAPMIMHLNENGVDNELIRRRCGKDAIAWLDEIDFLGPDFLAIHCVRMSEDEIRVLAERGVMVAYNPASNMYLGSGIAPMVKMAGAGITVGLGVDGAGSNNSQDMIETLKLAALLQKVGAQDASVIDAQTVLDWATLGGARILGMEDQIGSLEAGKKADLFVLSRNSAKIVPAHDPVTTLVYSAGEENVTMTIADGRVLMRDRVIQHLDEADILRRTQTAALALAARSGANRRLRRFWR
ncbi:MAG: amidohydrolase [Caldilineales bacterium]|nr:amidohydrolase [Caldilineales bacterium]MCW5858846.1 amidohydrolase [Caldilineales bacterium]